MIVGLNVTSIDQHRHFFVDTLGGTPVGGRSGSQAIIRFPRALIVLRQQAPTGGTKGTTVNHFAFGVPDIRETVAAVRAAGYPIVTRAEVAPTQDVKDGLAYMADQETDIAYTMAPDETKVEFIEIRTQPAAIDLHHVHFATPDVAAMKAWYVDVFDAVPGRRGRFEAADLAGVNLSYSPAAAAVVGTRGRSLDHIGFEVKGLEAFRRKLDAMAIPLDEPLTRVSALNTEAVFITDPWGTYIGVTEGLDRR